MNNAGRMDILKIKELQFTVQHKRLIEHIMSLKIAPLILEESDKSIAVFVHR